MDSLPGTRIRYRLPSLSLTGAIVALSTGVLVPVLLSTSVGIVTLVLGESSESILIGVLTVSFAAAALGGVAVVTWLLSRRARIARLQADLLANVSHDLRTPVTSIRMYAQTLLMGRLSQDPVRTQESLETIVRQTEWLEAMIDRVLTWRAAVRDRDALDPKVEPVGEAVEQAVARFGRMIPPDEARVTLHVETAVPVRHDRDAVGSIVLNLLLNAYKYSHAPREIRVEVLDQERLGRVLIAVEDNGVGIPRNELSRVFDPFYRLVPRREGAASGAGLGLAIVRYFARAQGGDVYVESEEGRGSRFVITLPVARAGGGGA
ncbi:MAG: HAMP domain-containing histidine kinase [Deltaproteobacteria bacterium]|nr:HAMP domain-containing histidine kinase [Deltaproteobacteria bacterium]